jgi:hypothetical protein
VLANLAALYPEVQIPVGIKLFILLLLSSSSGISNFLSHTNFTYLPGKGKSEFPGFHLLNHVFHHIWNWRTHYTCFGFPEYMVYGR